MPGEGESFEDIPDNEQSVPRKFTWRDLSKLNTLRTGERSAKLPLPFSCIFYPCCFLMFFFTEHYSPFTLRMPCNNFRILCRINAQQTPLNAMTRVRKYPQLYCCMHRFCCVNHSHILTRAYHMECYMHFS